MAARAGTGRDRVVTVVERGEDASAADLLDRALAGPDAPTVLRTGAAGRPVAVLVAAADGGPEADALSLQLVDRVVALLAEAGAGETVVLPATGRSGEPDVARAPAAVPEGSVLRGVELPEAWAADALRILVTRVATDPVEGFHGACAALAGLLPGDCALPGEEAVADLLLHLPPHLCVVDAVLAADGPFGSVRRASRRTGTVVVGASALAADEVVAALMGIDASVSAVVAHALENAPLPVPRIIRGDLEPWPGWRPAPRELVGACRRAQEVVPGFARVLRDVVADTPAAADDVVLKGAQRWIGTLAERAEDDAAALAGLVLAVESIAFWGGTARAWSTLLAKDRVPRRSVSLGLDLGQYRARDYDAVADYMAPLVQLADQAPVRGSGFRWRRHGAGVLFVMERELDASYDDFVARVDLSRAIRLMNDYIGGTAVVVARDRRGRVLRQAERNLYLPQPNYLAFSGGDVIDVCKLEVLRYGEAESRISWRTVRSPNGSAVHDDGAVTFRAAGPGRTLVRIHGLQDFALPPFWQAVDLARYPEVHDALTDDAYRRFFHATLDNFEAAYEGRETSTGRELERDPEPPTARLSRSLRMATEALGGDEQPRRGVRSAPVGELDDDGFRHVTGGAGTRLVLDRPASPWSGVVDDLRATLARDLGRDAGP